MSLEITTKIENQKKEIISALNKTKKDLEKLKIKWTFTNVVYSRYYFPCPTSRNNNILTLRQICIHDYTSRISHNFIVIVKVLQ